MAKVYSWEISQSPKKYAYIVSPKDTTNVYIGNELKGSNLEKVKEWATNCTDEEYKDHFEKMVNLCESSGYSVKFETFTTYLDVDTTCDNLRGPAGRGIDRVALYSTDSVRNVSTYMIYYDDGTSDTFDVQNGKDGKDGIDGSPGAKGDSGISSKFVMAYTSGIDEHGNLFTPSRPEGGSYDFLKNEMTYPLGWAPNDEEIAPPVWMSSRTFSSSEASTDKQWSLPVQITGDAGAPGKDGSLTEFIYCLDDNTPSVDNLESKNIAGYVPPIDTGWTPSPTGVDENHTTEWCSMRKLNRETNVWGPWEKPFIWSKYGVNGQDGDGVQYIFLKNKGELPENPTPIDFDTSKTYQNRDVEWLPEVDVSYVNIYGKDVKFSPIETLPEGSEAIPAGVWSDNPSNITAEYNSQWVSTRKYRKNAAGEMAWEAYSNPALWCKFGQDGKNATSIRKLYALSDSTSNPPDLPSDSTITGDWGTGFPIDYEAGVNVVWGTEAEIWAHNFEFVKSYKLASSKDSENNIVPPADYEDNFIDVSEIPTEEIKEYKYVRFNGEYYEWTGGWCKPYLVTGLKGENGNPIDFTTYVFAYGYSEYPPSAPTSKSAKNPGTSTDGLGTEIVWLDFPNTSGGKIDGFIDPDNNREMRWYQCTGFVDGYNGEVREWGPVYPCNGRDGEALPGRYTEVRFGVTRSSVKPEVDEYDAITKLPYREPSLYDDNGIKTGWFATDEELPDIPPGGTMWQIWAFIDGSDESVIITNGKAWNGPRRVSGEKGEQGIQGPAGMRGVTGIPGAKALHMYCLGTYGKNETSESYWETGGINGGDGYFGSKDWESGVIPDQMKDWYLSTDMPYSDVIEVTTSNDVTLAASKVENRGRVIKLIDTSNVTSGTSTFENVTHTYYMVTYDNKLKQLTQALSLAESDDFNVYVWCIQGNEVWKAGPYANYSDVTRYDDDGDILPPEDSDANNTIERDNVPNEKDELYKYIYCNNKYYEWKEIEGDKVQHTLDKVEWGSPFKLQGTNGLRGLSGSRGQVVYPMGVYNHEEVYITTEDKAPYVYDPNDGMFYVYNIVGDAWVGRLPGYDPETKLNDGTYKTIVKHPDDAEESFKVVTVNPETNQKEQVVGFKYLYFDGKYYSWDGKRYVLASKYKYSIDGSGRDGTWMTDQQGDTPANNYANAVNDNFKPAWVRFESFKALYTSIGIIENGMIGSAVYNNEFMFSQQGYAQDGKTITNYAVVSGKDTSYGFLSGYEYDERGEYKNGAPTGRHWKYKGTSKFIDNAAVNPYEKDKDDKYIHTFLPNVCINFATGQMWLSTGKIRFGSWDDRNVSTLEEVQDKITDASNKLQDLINDNADDLQQQIDKSANTYYQANDPSKDWQTTDNTALTTYAPERIGDLWFNTTKNKSYVFAHTDGGIPTAITDKGTYINSVNNSLKEANYYWVESDVPDSVYNRINTRSKIFVEEPKAPYYVGDLWFVHSDGYIEKEFYDGDKTITGINKGTCMVCMTSSDKTFSTKHWGKRDKYADEADVQNAQEELDAMNTQLSNWSDDNKISPVERLALKDEYNSVVAEYDSIIKQAETCGLKTDATYSDYKTAYTAAKRTFEYYIDSKNVATNSDCIKILTTGNYKYSNLKTYYEKRQLLLQKISDTLNGKIDDGLTSVRSEFAVADGKIEAKVTALKKDVEGQITEIQNSIITNENVSALISQALKDGEVVTKSEIATFITEGEAGELISNATIKADKVNIGGRVNINDVMTVDDNVVTISNANIENCEITNVTINGSLCSPFVLDDDTENVDNVYHDNFAIYTNSDDLQFGTYSKNLKWDLEQSGRKVSIVNHKWNGSLSNGRATLNAPSNYFKFSKMEDWARTDSPYSDCSLTYYKTTTTNFNDTTSSSTESTGSVRYSKPYFEEYQMSSPGAKHDNFLEFTIPSGLDSYTIYIQTTQKSTATTPESYNYYVYSVITADNGATSACLVYPNANFYRLIFSNLGRKERKISLRAVRNSAGTDKYVTRVILPKSNNNNAKYFYENGLQKTSISISRELVNLIGYGDASKFYGWIVSNRSDVETKYRYGQDMKVMAWGRIVRSNKNWDTANSYICTYDKTPATLAYCVNSKGNVEDGKYQIAFDSSWNNTIDDCMLFTNGYGLVYDTSTAPCKATWMPFRSSGNNVGITKGFEIWVSDDASLNDGSFYFFVVNSNLLSKLLLS